MGLNHSSLLNFTTLLDSVLWRLMPLHLRINPQVVTGSILADDFPRYSRENMSILSQLHRYELSFFRRFTKCKSISPGNSVFYTRQGITLNFVTTKFAELRGNLRGITRNFAGLNISATLCMSPCQDALLKK